MEDIRKIVEVLKGLERCGFSGFVTINFNRGGITQVEKNEELPGKSRKITKNQ